MNREPENTGGDCNRHQEGKRAVPQQKVSQSFPHSVGSSEGGFSDAFVIQFYDVALMTGTGDKHRYSGRHSRPHWKISFGSERSQSPRYALG